MYNLSKIFQSVEDFSIAVGEKYERMNISKPRRGESLG